MKLTLKKNNLKNLSKDLEVLPMEMAGDVAGGGDSSSPITCTVNASCLKTVTESKDCIDLPTPTPPPGEH